MPPPFRCADGVRGAVLIVPFRLPPPPTPSIVSPFVPFPFWKLNFDDKTFHIKQLNTNKLLLK